MMYKTQSAMEAFRTTLKLALEDPEKPGDR